MSPLKFKKKLATTTTQNRLVELKHLQSKTGQTQNYSNQEQGVLIIASLLSLLTDTLKDSDFRYADFSLDTAMYANRSHVLEVKIGGKLWDRRQVVFQNAKPGK